MIEHLCNYGKIKFFETFGRGRRQKRPRRR
jgi:hypothetical protein